jgi:glutathione S-transferase
MKLYEFGPTRSIRARWMLQELGVEFEAVSADLTGREHDSLAMTAVLEKQLRGRDYVVGDRVTAADIVLAYTLDVADEMELAR